MHSKRVTNYQKIDQGDLLLLFERKKIFFVDIHFMMDHHLQLVFLIMVTS